MADSNSFSGKTAIVTGAARGVGEAVVRMLHERGANVVAEDRNPAVKELASERVATLIADVGEEKSATEAVALATDRFGGLDVLVNNAARFLQKSALETTPEEVDGLFRNNATGVFMHCRAAIPRLIESGSGAIVNVASISGLIGQPDQIAYSMTKGAVIQLTRVLAIELGGKGVRVNAVAPGGINTKFVEDAVGAERPSDEDPEAFAAKMSSLHPIGRYSEPTEVAETICFLASPAASTVTGAIFTVDGGFTAQ